MFLLTPLFLHILRVHVPNIRVFCFVVSIYTKPKGQIPDYSAPVVLHDSSPSIEDFCNKLHKQMISQFKVAVCSCLSVLPLDPMGLILIVHTVFDSFVWLLLCCWRLLFLLS